MPQTSSANKALRVSARRRTINDRLRATLQRLERTLKKALVEKNADVARTTGVKLQSTLDRMARRRILHRNTAARKKSRMALLVRHGAGSSSAAPAS